MAKMTFAPTILQTKEELLTALKVGKIKSSKYNALNEDEKLFVELIVFGGYKPGQAMKVIRPHLADPQSAGQRMIHNQDVVDVMEELVYKRDKSWLAQVTSSREVALQTMEYIMKTTHDENLMVATAKAIIEAADRSMKQGGKKDDERVTGLTFNIQIASVPESPTKIIEDAEVVDMDAEIEVVDKEAEEATGLSYKLNYTSQAETSYKKDE